MVRLLKCEMPPRKGVEVAVESTIQKSMVMYLWFYEWNMFEATRNGQHTGCNQNFYAKVSNSGKEAVIRSEAMQLTCNAKPNGVDLSLSLTNNTQYEWSKIAGIIPCFHPGRPQWEKTPINHLFTDDEHKRTFFFASENLELLKSREIHFNSNLQPELEKVSPAREFAFSHKWPTSEANAGRGIMIRESKDDQWVTGIAWKHFLSAQGHNPLRCMHLAVKVGPLKPSEKKTIQGKIYLFRGKKEECLRRYSKDFGMKE